MEEEKFFEGEEKMSVEEKSKIIVLDFFGLEKLSKEAADSRADSFRQFCAYAMVTNQVIFFTKDGKEMVSYCTKPQRMSITTFVKEAPQIISSRPQNSVLAFELLASGDTVQRG